MSAAGDRADVPATWPGSLLVAEAVEKVGAVRVFAIIVRVSRTHSNVASIKPRTLYHYFKNFELRDFFNTLSQERS